jgi:pimeloyl-ACP methyl ester carboxylesterase
MLALSLLLLPVPLSAKTVVFVHGFQSNGMEWRTNGVTSPLLQRGWRDGGHFIMTAQGPYNPQPPLAARPEQVFYTLSLPSGSPILLQASLLDSYLQSIYAQRQEPLTLVGHSAGGVVARSWLVRTATVPVDALITIATPHLGTPLADVAKQAAQTPMATFANHAGFSQWLEKAENLYSDLSPETPGKFLYWLNHQPHPFIRYVSIVRDNEPRPDRYDFTVPTYSQDMNNVFALRGASEVFSVKGSHFPSVYDGFALAEILSRQ